MERQPKIILSIINSAVLVIIFVAAITIFADLVPALKNWLKDTFTHHWIGKSILATGLFVFASIPSFVLPEKISSDKIISRLWVLIIATAISFLAITGFFAYEAFFAA